MSVIKSQASALSSSNRKSIQSVSQSDYSSFSYISVVTKAGSKSRNLPMKASKRRKREKTGNDYEPSC